MTEQNRNSHVLTFEVEFTEPIADALAPSAAELLAKDVKRALGKEWGYGRARIEAVYAPSAQFSVKA